MNIWFINHYAVPPRYYPLARQTIFANHLMEMGHTVTIFAASAVHNSDTNLITDGASYREDVVDGVHYVYVKTSQYEKNDIKRIVNMFQFPLRLSAVCKRFQKPDVVVSTSMTPMACKAGLKIARKYGAKAIAEVADLWPESFVALDLMSLKNPLLIPMYYYEKRMYAIADAIVFTMEGGKDYIIEKGWDTAHGGPVDLAKINHINNGVDLEVFEQNKSFNDYYDEDLENNELFKVVYTGSIRLVNQVDKLVDVAKILKGKSDRVKILLWGAGDQCEPIAERIQKEGLTNIALKGRVPKETVPQILAKSDLNIYILADSPLYRFGLSLNKSFEYFAAGKPVLASANSGYSIIDRYQCGVCLDGFTPEKMADKIMQFANLPPEKYETYCHNAKRAAQEYDFKVLTEKLLAVMEGR